MTHVSDELLSALVDGEPLPAPDVAHVEECVTCQERVDEFRRVAAAVGAPVALPAGHLREAAVAIALDEATGAAANVRRLRDRRAQAAKTPTRRMSALSAAAALAVALGVGGWAISQVSNDSRNTGADLSTAADDFGSSSAAGSNEAAADAAGGGRAQTMLAAPAAYDGGDIGAFSDATPIAARARDDLAQPDTVRAQRPYAGPSPCGEQDLVQWHAALTYNGEPAWARVITSAADQWLLQVHRQTDCVLLVTQAFAPTPPR